MMVKIFFFEIITNNKVKPGLPEVHDHISHGVLEWWRDFDFGFRNADF
jgi:hypothetical protein